MSDISSPLPEPASPDTSCVPSAAEAIKTSCQTGRSMIIMAVSQIGRLSPPCQRARERATSQHVHDSTRPTRTEYRPGPPARWSHHSEPRWLGAVMTPSARQHARLRGTVGASAGPTAGVSQQGRNRPDCHSKEATKPTAFVTLSICTLNTAVAVCQCCFRTASPAIAHAVPSGTADQRALAVHPL